MNVKTVLFYFPKKLISFLTLAYVLSKHPPTKINKNMVSKKNKLYVEVEGAQPISHIIRPRPRPFTSEWTMQQQGRRGAGVLPDLFAGAAGTAADQPTNRPDYVPPTLWL